MYLVSLTYLNGRTLRLHEVQCGTKKLALKQFAESKKVYGAIEVEVYDPSDNVIAEWGSNGVFSPILREDR